jgi:CDP-glucose 4,6-dehydratase
MLGSWKSFFNGKRILITGHTGFKGSWLTQILLNLGANVIGCALKPHTNPNLFEILELEKCVGNYYVDIRRYGEVKRVFEKEKPKIVFHLALNH